MNRREFLAATGVLASLGRPSLRLRSQVPIPEKGTGNLYWGDLHCHCDISYGRGSLKNAFAIAQANRLDFCSIVGHASWHDTPRGEGRLTERLKDYIAYHDQGHARLAKVWPDVKRVTREATKPGSFVPFLGFEWSSTTFGDYNVYFRDPEGDIVSAESIEALREKLRDQEVLLIPHHIGYVRGSRGVNWASFVPSHRSPFIEVYSFHGCAVSDSSPYPYLLETGPRSSEGTADACLARGHHVGFVASTDNHIGFPGSYGEGLMACRAERLTPESLWEAFQKRRVYAVTGDRIDLDFSMGDAVMGAEVSGRQPRDFAFRVEGDGLLDYVDLTKNGRVLARFTPEPVSPRTDGLVCAKIRFEWGWGKKGEGTAWNGRLRLSEGRLLKVTPYFRPRPLTDAERAARTKSDDENGKFSRITEQSETGCAFTSHTLGNPIPLYSLNCSVVLDVQMPVRSHLAAEINGNLFTHSLADLLAGQRAHLVDGYLGPAVVFHRAVLEPAFTLAGRFVDRSVPAPFDAYYLTVRQKNDQWAWSSPISVRL